MLVSRFPGIEHWRECRLLIDGGEKNGQLGIFLRIQHGGNGDPKVGDWAPEICRVALKCQLESRITPYVKGYSGHGGSSTHGSSTRNSGQAGSVSSH